MKTKLSSFALLLLSAAHPSFAQNLPNFTRIDLDGAIFFGGASWADYDGDGYLDLIVANGVATSGRSNFVYKNNGDGTFTPLTSGSIPTDIGYSLGIAWGDYDNDGLPDVFFGQDFPPASTVPGLFYENQGAGSFTKVTKGELVTKPGNFLGVWGDYNNDGLLDLFVAATAAPNLLFRNNGDGTFTRVSTAMSVTSPSSRTANGATWADYDNDGSLDIFLFNGAGQNALFHNNGDGTFTQVHGAPFDTDLAHATGAAWADYDNDGWLDLFIENGGFDTVPRQNYLYHNNRDGTFSKVTTGVLATDSGSSLLAAWEDFDNDGNIDLIVSQNTGSGSPPSNNRLYHNEGNGSFTRVTDHPLVADPGHYAAVAWGDYDEDGFPDLFVVAGQPSYLFHNEGNANYWINFKLVGTASNRSAIGAKVRVKATIRGNPSWQMREIGNGDSLAGNSLNPHFGLGDATNIDLVRIEWPSGTVQELQNISAKQTLSITEPARLQISQANDSLQFTLRGGRGFKYDIQASANLASTWSSLGEITITNINGTASITETNGIGSTSRFYRAVRH
jgi:hypothetical protein